MGRKVLPTLLVRGGQSAIESQLSRPVDEMCEGDSEWLERGRAGTSRSRSSSGLMRQTHNTKH